MASIVSILNKKQLCRPPTWLPGNIHYETMMGSIAYGISSDMSDVDVYGFCIPKKEMIFPHLVGEIPGFGKQIQRFDQWQEHHIKDKDSKKEYDCSIYNIVKYFQLAMENNPNMIDSLFTPDSCVLHISRIGTMVRENRKLFLHKGCWPKFKGYAFSQMHKAKLKTPLEGSKRDESVKKFGWDVKFGYHVVRLIGEVEQILMEGDLDLQRNREHMKAIRRGEVTLEDTQQWFSEKEKDLEKVYAESKLRHRPDEGAIKQLLLNCLEDHYGSLQDAICDPNQAIVALRQIQEIIEKNRSLI